MKVLVLQHIACEPPVYEHVLFHLEVSTGMARECAAAPASEESLERVLGAGAAEDFVARIEERSSEMLAHGRALFERWLDVVVTPRAVAA